MNVIEENKYGIYLLGYSYPADLKLNFEYNDEKKELKIHSINRKKSKL